MSIPYDPDFDKSPRRPWGDVFAALGSMRSFLVGFVFSLLVLSTTGFIIMLFR